MFRRQLLRQSRTLSESLSSLPRTQSSRFSSASPITSRPLAASISSRLPSRRWQSTEAEKKSEEAPAADAPPAAEQPPAEDPVKAELEKSKKEVIDLKDKYLRSVADFRNLQDRMKREQESTRSFAIQRFATDLLDSIDNLDRALSSVPPTALGKPATAAAGGAAPATSEPVSEPNKDLLSLYSGLRMTEEILLNTLAKHGLERFDPMDGEGRKFDPNTDEATFFTKVEGKNDGDVFFTQSKGFRLNGRVVRAAKVGVVKNS